MASRHYQKVQGRLSRPEFDAKVRAKITEWGGLLDQDAASLLVLEEMGVDVAEWTPVGKLEENAGLDAIDLLIALRTKHEGKKGKNIGVDLSKGEPGDMLEAKVIEPLRVKRQAIESASEVANMILRIDDVIAAKKMSGGGAPGGEGHEHGGMGGMGGMPPGMGM